MANERTLPGFDNVMAEQLDDDRVMLYRAFGETSVGQVIDRREYDSDQEFMMECIQWARRNGGIEVPS